MAYGAFSPGYSLKSHSGSQDVRRGRSGNQSGPRHAHPRQSYSDEECTTDSYVLSPKHKVPITPEYASLNQEVEKLQNSLHKTNHSMTENERMLSNYRLANTRQSRKMEELRGELNLSRDILASRSHTPGSREPCSSCGHAQQPGLGLGFGQDHEKQLMSELEKEKQARERAEYSSAQMMTLLDSSLRNASSAPSAAKEDVREDMSGHLKELEDSHKKLENSAEVYDQRLKEIEEKLKESSSSETQEAFEELVQQVSQLKHDLWQRDASEKRRKMLQQIQDLENDLSVERQKHSSSVRHTHKLYSQVKQLGQELGQVKQEKEQAMSCLEATNHHLNESLGGKEELIQRIEELQEALASSESQRFQFVEKCGQLSQECFKQEVCQESLRQRIKEVEHNVEACGAERASFEENQHILAKKLTDKTVSECRLQDQCDILQKRQTDIEAALDRREVELEAVVSQLEIEQRQCNEYKLEMVQLTADLKTAEGHKDSLDSQIQTLESNLYGIQDEFEKLKTELKEVTDQLLHCTQDKKSLESRVEEERRKYEQSCAQRKALQNNLASLQHQLEESEKRQVSSYSQALQAVKKFKNKAKQIAQEKNQLQEERDACIAHNKDLQKQLSECQQLLKHEQCRFSQKDQESSELNTRLSTVQRERDDYADERERLHHQVVDMEGAYEEQKTSMEKLQHELTQCQHDNEHLKQEITTLTQNLESSQEQSRGTEKRMNIELLNTREQSNSKIEQLKAEVEVGKTEKSKLAAKQKKLVGAYQVLKSESEELRIQCDQIIKQKGNLESDLNKMQQEVVRKDRDIVDRTETLKCLQNQELKKLKLKHSQVVSELQHTISSLEMRMADEQAVLCDVQKQQLRVLDDQQKVYAADLSRSMEDTEKVRHKYLRAKKKYEEKAATLENEFIDFSGENESLRHKLNESQVSLLQQVEEHESILRTAAKEVDSIVHQMGLRVDVPMFPTIVGDETDIKKWMADMIAKLKWLQREVTDLLSEENKLRLKIKSEHKGSDSLDS